MDDRTGHDDDPHRTLTGTLDPAPTAGYEATSIDTPTTLTVHLDGALPPAPALTRLTDELAAGLLLDIPIGDGLVLHQLTAESGVQPRVISADARNTAASALIDREGDDPGGEGRLFLFDAVNRTSVGVRADTVEQARDKIGRAFADEIGLGRVHEGVTLRATSLWQLAAQPFDIDGGHHEPGDEATPAMPWDVAHTRPQVTDVVGALRDAPRLVPLWVDTPEEAEALLAALHAYARLAPCATPGVDCGSDEAACVRHGLAQKLTERLTAAVLPPPDPDAEHGPEDDTEPDLGAHHRR